MLGLVVVIDYMLAGGIDIHKHKRTRFIHYIKLFPEAPDGTAGNTKSLFVLKHILRQMIRSGIRRANGF